MFEVQKKGRSARKPWALPSRMVRGVRLGMVGAKGGSHGSRKSRDRNFRAMAKLAAAARAARREERLAAQVSSVQGEEPEGNSSPRSTGESAGMLYFDHQEDMVEANGVSEVL